MQPCLLRVCVLFFLLVVGHSPAAEDHCGKNGKSWTVNGASSKGEARPLCYLS